MGGLAFALRYLTWPQAALLALVALVFNATLLTRVLPGIVRPAAASGYRAGVLFYPLALLALVFIFRERLDIVAAAWAVMAFGDGAATLAGTHVGGRRLPWNPEKTWSGLIAFAVAGSLGAVALSVWVAPVVMPTPPWLFTWAAPIVAAIVAAFAETIPIKLDDNLTVPFAAGLTLAAGAAVDPVALQTEYVHFTHRVGWAVLATAAWSWGAWKVRALTVPGAAMSTIMGAAIFALGGFQCWLLYFSASVVAVTSWRVAQKRRGPTHASHRVGSAIASCVIGVIGAWLMAAIDANAAGALIAASGLAAWASEAVADEIDNGYGAVGSTVAVAITSTTMAGLFALAFPDLRLLAPFVVLGSAAGAATQRALARKYEGNGVLNHDVLLFLNTFVAATVACASVLVVVALRNQLP